MNPIHTILFLVFGIGTMLDLIFSGLGVVFVLQPQNVLTYFVVVAGSLAEVGIRLCYPITIKQGGFYFWLKGMFYFCIVFDPIAIGIALIAFVLLKKPFTADGIINWQQVSAEPVGHKLLIFVLLCFLTTSPIMLSHLFKEYMADQFDDETKGHSDRTARASSAKPR